jgi:hypothetical protein
MRISRKEGPALIQQAGKEEGRTTRVSMRLKGPSFIGTLTYFI